MALRVSAVFPAHQLPQSRAAVVSVDDPDAIGAGPHPAQGGVQRHPCLIFVFPVEIDLPDPCVHPVASCFSMLLLYGKAVELSTAFCYDKERKRVFAALDAAALLPPL